MPEHQIRHVNLEQLMCCSIANKLSLGIRRSRAHTYIRLITLRHERTLFGYIKESLITVSVLAVTSMNGLLRRIGQHCK